MTKRKHFLIYLCSLFSLGFLGFSVPSAFAAETSNAEVLGFVKNCSENVPFQPVTATCGTQTLSGSTGSTTGDYGKYSLTFHNASCDKGSTVSVTSGGVTNTGTMGSFLWFSNKAYVDIQTGSGCETASVPEYGPIAQIMAILVAGGAFLYLRRSRAET